MSNPMPELLVLVRRRDGFAIQPLGIVIFGDDEATANRLVACWNACRGLSTEALEAGELSILVRSLGYPVASPEAARGMTALARLTRHLRPSTLVEERRDTGEMSISKKESET